VRIKPNQYLRGDIESELATLLIKEVEFHLQLEEVKRELLANRDFKASRVFKMLDPLRSNLISPTLIKRFLMKMGHQVQPYEAMAIVRRIDMDGDN
jgi:hypothetical protein